jgi:hypothetical protein
MKAYLCAQHLDSENVQALATNIFGTHVDDALHTELGAGGSGSDAVLASTSLSNDSFLTQSLGEQDLTDGVVDFMGSSVVANDHICQTESL